MIAVGRLLTCICCTLSFIFWSFHMSWTLPSGHCLCLEIYLLVFVCVLRFTFLIFACVLRFTFWFLFVSWALLSGPGLFPEIYLLVFACVLRFTFWSLLVSWDLPSGLCLCLEFYLLVIACVLRFPFWSLFVSWALLSGPGLCLEIYLVLFACVLKFTFWSLFVSWDLSSGLCLCLEIYLLLIACVYWDLPSGPCLCLERYLHIFLLIPRNKIVSSFCTCYLWALQHHIRSSSLSDSIITIFIIRFIINDLRNLSLQCELGTIVTANSVISLNSITRVVLEEMETRVCREVESEYTCALVTTVCYLSKGRRKTFVKRIHAVFKQINQMRMQGQPLGFCIWTPDGWLTRIHLEGTATC